MAHFPREAVACRACAAGALQPIDNSPRGGPVAHAIKADLLVYSE
jgi:hypothetical protein